MTSQINTVVFDLGGVLIDWNPRYLYRKLFAGNDAAMEDFLANVCTSEWHEHHDAGVKFADNAAPLLQKYAHDPHMQKMIEAWGLRFWEMVGGPIAETVEILQALHETGINLYALTNWAEEFFAPAYRQFDFLPLFKDIVVSGKEKIKKPDIVIYDILIKRTRLDPRRALYIDDRAYNLVPAAALGFTTHLFTTPDALASELERLNILRSQFVISKNVREA